jgi:cation diffusion facilitator family transporter
MGRDFDKAKKILLRTLILNWLVALAKIFVGILSGSLSILTDGFHSFFDGMSNILGLAGLRVAEQPKDSSHPYGHQKFEALAALGIAVLIVLTAYELLKSTINRVLHPLVPEISILTFLVMGGALLVDIFVFWYENYWGRKIKSTILIADSLHTKSHLLTTPTVILGLVAIKAGFPIFDPLIASFIVFMLGKLAWEIIRDSSSTLCDYSLVNVGEIKKIASVVKGIKSSHHIRSRGDEHHIFLDMHITLDPNISLERAHYISHQLEEKITKENPQIKDVIIHIEPQ